MILLRPTPDGLSFVPERPEKIPRVEGPVLQCLNKLLRILVALAGTQRHRIVSQPLVDVSSATKKIADSHENSCASL